MLCTFCGTENRPEYKFCGICGVRLDRRQMERRSTQGVSTKCSACGHVSEPGLKFCGMCGAKVDRRTQERRNSGDEPRAAAIANAQLPTPEIKGRTVAPVATRPEPLEGDAVLPLPRKGEPAIFRNDTQRNEPQGDEIQTIEPRRNDLGNGRTISGPSFLGLNSQPEEGVEYLLEDEPTGGGLRKFILVIILAAIVGLVFVQWRSSLKANPKPAPAKTDPATSPSPVPQGSNQPQGATDPASTDTKAAAVGVDSAAENAAAGESKDKKADNISTSDGAAATSTTPAEAEDPVDKKTAPEQTPPASDSKPAEEAKLPDYKPTAALLRAQQYIRGHGVQQNCEQGLLYLRAATDKNDPGAAIQMAALYSSGLCVKQDRVMAYRWFNSAHELQPANMWIQKNMDQLWAQMSSQERRLAGY